MSVECVCALACSPQQHSLTKILAPAAAFARTRTRQHATTTTTTTTTHGPIAIRFVILIDMGNVCVRSIDRRPRPQIWIDGDVTTQSVFSVVCVGRWTLVAPSIKRRRSSGHGQGAGRDAEERGQIDVLLGGAAGQRVGPTHGHGGHPWWDGGAPILFCFSIVISLPRRTRPR